MREDIFDDMMVMLRVLSRCVRSAPQYAGRPRLAIEDAVYACAVRSYCGATGRRSIDILKDLDSKGLISKVPSYNSIFRRVSESSSFPQTLSDLLTATTIPFRNLEVSYSLHEGSVKVPAMMTVLDSRLGRDVTRNARAYCVLGFGRVTGLIYSASLAPHGRNSCRLEDEMAKPGVPEISVDLTPVWRRLSEQAHGLAYEAPEVLGFRDFERRVGSSLNSKTPVGQWTDFYLKCLSHNAEIWVETFRRAGISGLGLDWSTLVAEEPSRPWSKPSELTERIVTGAELFSEKS